MTQKSKETTTEKILWGIFDSLEILSDLSYPLSGEGVYDRAYNGGYGNIMRKIRWQRNRHQFVKFINDLKRRGYIKIGIEKDKNALILTPKGYEKILKINVQRFDKKKRHDKKWQMIIWDIPESYRKTRNRFRDALKLLGYQKLQESVWVCPYDILKETEGLIRFYRLESYVRLFLISEIKT